MRSLREALRLRKIPAYAPRATWPATGRTYANTGDDRFPVFYGGPRLVDLLQTWDSPFYVGEEPDGFLDRYLALAVGESWHEPSEDEIESARIRAWRRFGSYAGNWPDYVNLESDWVITPRGLAIHFQMIDTLTEKETNNVR